MLGHYAWIDSINDICLLKSAIENEKEKTLLEVGCATGELYRYLRANYPYIYYYGIDISRYCIERAKEKYPNGHFITNSPNEKISKVLKAKSLLMKPEIVYAKDVL